MEMHFHINLNQPQWTRNWSLKRKLIVFLGLALVLAPAAFVVASDNFSDVPDNHLFHDSINAIYESRITVGCAPGLFCPEANLTRGQMAAFLQRGLGRTAYERSTGISLNDGLNHDLVVLRINTGGALGGTGYLKVDATFEANYLGTAGCPCRVEYYLEPAGGAISQFYSMTLYNTDGVVFSTGSGAATIAFPLPTGNLEQIVYLKAKLVQSTGTPSGLIFTRGEMTAIWAPFGRTGGLNPANASAEQEGQAP